jgi:hypothetical protein
VTANHDDRQEIELVASRLGEAFPKVPAEFIREAIIAAWSKFDGSKIRDFVPVLAERLAKVQLRGTAA